MATLKKMVLASEFVIWPQTLDREARKQIHMTTLKTGLGIRKMDFSHCSGNMSGIFLMKKMKSVFWV